MLLLLLLLMYHIDTGLHSFLLCSTPKRLLLLLPLPLLLLLLLLPVVLLALLLGLLLLLLLTLAIFFFSSMNAFGALQTLIRLLSLLTPVPLTLDPFCSETGTEGNVISYTYLQQQHEQKTTKKAERPQTKRNETNNIHSIVRVNNHKASRLEWRGRRGRRMLRRWRGRRGERDGRRRERG